MKTIKAATLILLISTSCYAQFQKEDLKVGISAGYGSRTSSEYKNIIVNPHVSYYLMNKLMVYAEGNAYHVFSEDQRNDDVEFKSYNTYDVGLGMGYAVLSSPYCGTIILGSGLYKRENTDEIQWLFTPRLSFDLGKCNFEILSDISITDLANSQRGLYSSLEFGLFWKL